MWGGCQGYVGTQQCALPQHSGPRHRGKGSAPSRQATGSQGLPQRHLTVNSNTTGVAQCALHQLEQRAIQHGVPSRPATGAQGLRQGHLTVNSTGITQCPLHRPVQCTRQHCSVLWIRRDSPTQYCSVLWFQKNPPTQYCALSEAAITRGVPHYWGITWAALPPQRAAQGSGGCAKCSTESEISTAERSTESESSTDPRSTESSSTARSTDSRPSTGSESITESESITDHDINSRERSTESESRTDSESSTDPEINSNINNSSNNNSVGNSAEGSTRSASQAQAPDALPSMEQVLASLREKGVSVAVSEFGPFFSLEATSVATGEKLGYANGFVRPTLTGMLLHLDTIRLEGLGMRRAPGVRTVLGMGFLLGAVLMRHGIDRGCARAELLAINDSDEFHAKLVRYYQRLGMRVTEEVTGERLRDVGHMLVWGGVGTKMECDPKDILAKWSSSFKKQL